VTVAGGGTDGTVSGNDAIAVFMGGMYVVLGGSVAVLTLRDDALSSLIGVAATLRDGALASEVLSSSTLRVDASLELLFVA
jgi:hypothetical protein